MKHYCITVLLKASMLQGYGVIHHYVPKKFKSDPSVGRVIATFSGFAWIDFCRYQANWAMQNPTKSFLQNNVKSAYRTKIREFSVRRVSSLHTILVHTRMHQYFKRCKAFKWISCEIHLTVLIYHPSDFLSGQLKEYMKDKRFRSNNEIKEDVLLKQLLKTFYEDGFRKLVLDGNST